MIKNKLKHDRQNFEWLNVRACNYLDWSYLLNSQQVVRQNNLFSGSHLHWIHRNKSFFETIHKIWPPTPIYLI